MTLPFSILITGMEQFQNWLSHNISSTSILNSDFSEQSAAAVRRTLLSKTEKDSVSLVSLSKK